MAEQRNQAKTRTAAQDEDSLPCLRNFPGHLCSQRDPNSGVRKDLSWRRPRLVNAVSAAVRQDWTITRCQEQVRFDRRYTASLCADYASCSQTRPHDCTDCTRLYNTVYYAVLLMKNDQIRSKHVEQIKKLWNKIDYKNCASRWSLTHCISPTLPSDFTEIIFIEM